MLAAVYARKSTEQNGVSDEEKSVTRQIEHAKAYAAKKGWTVDESFIFVDDGISGAEFVKRYGLARLLNTLKPRAPFQVLIMMEESRLGREQAETLYVLKQITDAGVRVFLYATDRERRLDTAIDKVMLSLENFASEVERERASQRTYEVMLGKAKAGHVTGGRVYGYTNVRMQTPDGGRMHVRRQVHEAEAAIVHRIFQLYADGKGLSRIAKTLNADGIAPPRHGQGWAPSAIREMLHRRLYLGEIVWNEYQKIVRGGTKQRRRRLESEWIKLDAKELQIIPALLWDAVHARLARYQAAFGRNDAGRLVLGRPAGPVLRDFESPYLLSGIARCATCGGSIAGLTHYGKTRGRFYRCNYNWKRGPSICTASVIVPQDIVDREILAAVEQHLDPRVFQRALEMLAERLRASYLQRDERRTELERDLLDVDRKTQHLVDAIARGEVVDPLIARLKAEQARKQTLVAELQGLPAVRPELDPAKVLAAARHKLDDLRDLLRRHPSQARQVLRKLTQGHLMCEAVEIGGKRGFRITGQATYLPVLPEIFVTPTVVSPTGTAGLCTMELRGVIAA
jgi:DNA invertase Pin-like site-specific DNA recombinase